MLEQLVDPRLLGPVGERDVAAGSRGSGTRRRRWSMARPRAIVSSQASSVPRAGVVAVAALPGLEEHLLLDVLGRGAVVEQAQQEAERRAPVQRVELAHAPQGRVAPGA